MKIELKSLDLVHFKCFPKLHLDFHEGVNSLFGANAAGKTSVYDALTWLLFDKDSAGHSRPAIKPTGAPAGTMPEVTAILEVDGEPIKLRKVLREKWEKPRGSSIERYAGDTRDYYIDDVPLAENAYKRRIAELIDERQFTSGIRQRAVPCQAGSRLHGLSESQRCGTAGQLRHEMRRGSDLGHADAG